MGRKAVNMFENFFSDPNTLFMGAVTGLAFGFLLQKGGVTRFNVIMGQFLFKDFTVLKIMLTAIITGAIGIYGMRALGLEFSLHIKNTALLGNATGGLIFGSGMAILGYCPGTGIAAIGDGSRHAIFGVLGMLVGTALYAEAYPWIKSYILDVGNFGKVNFEMVTGLSSWWFIVVLLISSGVGFSALERWEQRH
jgi:hypothetical protein